MKTMTMTMKGPNMTDAALVAVWVMLRSMADAVDGILLVRGSVPRLLGLDDDGGSQ